jgi:hypothetical protein
VSQTCPPRSKFEQISWQGTASVLAQRAGGSLKEREPELDYDEVIVSMLLAFCIGNAMITLIYRIVT